MSKDEKNILLSYLWKMEFNRNFVLEFYDQVEESILNLKEEIEEELK